LTSPRTEEDTVPRIESGWVKVLLLACATGCPEGARLEGDGAGPVEDGRAEGADGRDDGGRADDGAEAEADVDPCGPPGCVNDPVDGIVGGPCVEDSDCPTGTSCWPEDSAAFDGVQYFTWLGGYCAVLGWGGSTCDTYDPTTCPDGSVCVPFGQTPSGHNVSGCLDDCAVASSTGVPWTTNCDCRQGYQCHPVWQFCISGCTSDAECCEIWHDIDKDGTRNTGEVTRLGRDRCTDVCDPCTFACRRDGCPGGDCRIGGPCEHDSDCPPLSSCIDEFYTEGRFPGGLCIRERCDLVGRECPVGSGCGNLGSFYQSYRACLVPCPAGADPGAPGNPCRDVDPPGPSLGDYACQPAADEAFWMDETVATGYCWAGSFPGGDRPLGATCLLDEECISPHGLGLCLSIPGFPSECSAMCNAALAADGMCETDPTSPVASGVCALGVCTPACSEPNGPLGANGCPSPTLACYLTAAVGRWVSARAGVARPEGFCFPSCISDVACEQLWGGERPMCNTVSGVCERS
jgi:hypothetical protein